MRRHGHVHLSQVLGVREVLVHVTRLYIQRLQRIQGRVGFFGSRVFLNRLTISGNSLLVLLQVAVQHRALQRSLAGYGRVRIGAQQLLIRTNSGTLVIQLQLRTGNLVQTVIRIIGLGITAH